MRFFRPVLVALALSVGVVAAAGSAQSPAAKDAKGTDESCRIAGMVVKLADGAPLKGATVRLENGEDHEHTIAAKTAADGRFALKNVPAGRYKLIVSRNGYVDVQYGQRKPSDPGAVFSLSPGQTKANLSFKMVPSAVIAGRVFDEDGEPVPYASVIASRETYQEGRRALAAYTQVMTDDLGAFRLFGLPPGRYFVSAMQRQWGQVVGDKEFSGGAERSAEQSYTKTYYPGTLDIGRATAINVKEGDEIPGTDIALKQVRVHRIRGRVLNRVTADASRDMEVLLVARTKRPDWEFGGQAEVKKADGSFEVSDVAPGSYTLIAVWYDESERRMHFGSQRIDVGDDDLEGLSVVVGSGATIQGRVVWEGRASLERDQLSINAALVDAGVLPTVSARVDANQQFTLQELIEGEVRVQVSGASKDCYVKRITYGQTFVKDDVITVSKGASPALEITISSKGARVQGSVTDKDGLPAAGVWVVGVPDEARRSTPRFFKSQTTDQYGKFDLHGLAPGTYKFFAWDEVEANAWEDQDFLKRFEPQGAEIEVHDEGAASVNLPVISAKSEK